MPPVRLNFSNADNREFEPLPIGDYPATVSDVDMRTSKSSGYDYLNFEFTVNSGKFKGRKLWTIASLSPAAQWKMKEILMGLGEPAEILVDGYPLDLASLIGRNAILTVDIETQTYEDKGVQKETQRNVVNKVTAAAPLIDGGPSMIK